MTQAIRLSLNPFWNIKCLQEHNLSWAVAGRHEGRLRAALARAGAVVEADLKAGKEVLKLLWRVKDFTIEIGQGNTVPSKMNYLLLLYKTRQFILLGTVYRIFYSLNFWVNPLEMEFI